MAKRRLKDDPRGPAICGANTAEGDACLSRVSVQMTPQGPRCINHDPRRREELRAMSMRGAQRSARVRAGRKAADAEELWALWPLLDEAGAQRALATPEDCAALASWVVEQVVRDR